MNAREKKQRAKAILEAMAQSAGEMATQAASIVLAGSPLARAVLTPLDGDGNLVQPDQIQLTIYVVSPPVAAVLDAVVAMIDLGTMRVEHEGKVKV